jgi:hypothetical protein
MCGCWSILGVDMTSGCVHIGAGEWRDDVYDPAMSMSINEAMRYDTIRYPNRHEKHEYTKFSQSYAFQGCDKSTSTLRITCSQ